MTKGVLLVAKITAVVFVTTSMASAGLGVTPRDVLGQLRRTRLVAIVLLANFAIAPLIAWGLCRLIPIEQATRPV